MTKKELFDWVTEPLPDGFVSQEDMAKALFISLNQSRKILDVLADELAKLDPGNPALSEYRKFTAVTI